MFANIDYKVLRVVSSYYLIKVQNIYHKVSHKYHKFLEEFAFCLILNLNLRDSQLKHKTQ